MLPAESSRSFPGGRNFDRGRPGLLTLLLLLLIGHS